MKEQLNRQYVYERPKKIYTSVLQRIKLFNREYM